MKHIAAIMMVRRSNDGRGRSPVLRLTADLAGLDAALPADFDAARAAGFNAVLVARFFVGFTRSSIFRSEARRNVRSSDSRYLIDPDRRFAFLARTPIPSCVMP
jgi:hypothetical protein